MKEGTDKSCKSANVWLNYPDGYAFTMPLTGLCCRTEKVNELFNDRRTALKMEKSAEKPPFYQYLLNILATGISIADLRDGFFENLHEVGILLC